MLIFVLCMKNFDSLIDFSALIFDFDLIDFKQSRNAKPDIICLIETKLKDIPYANINISIYNFYHFPTPTNAGGVAIYISLRFVVQNVHTQFLKTDMCEDMFVELCSQDGIQYICGTAYRHPKCNFKTFNTNLQTQIMQLNKDKKNLLHYRSF